MLLSLYFPEQHILFATIRGKAQFMKSCSGKGPRTYFYILENGIESNYPLYGCIPSCCNLPDMISKVYYDRGPWDKFCCMRAIGCVTGPPVFFGHVRK